MIQSQCEVRAAITSGHDWVWASIASPGAALFGTECCGIVSEVQAQVAARFAWKASHRPVASGWPPFKSIVMGRTFDRN